jgi:sucrose-6-phosphate hydrolase SacC (GH32 family)
LTFQGKTKWVLIVSLNPGGPNGGSATQYFIGNFDGKSFKPDALPYPLWLDYGRDNYAGVTFNNIPATDGRRIFMGWMSNWDYANQVPTKYFRSANTSPRELKIVNNGKHMILSSFPVVEMNKIKDKMIELPDLQVAANATIAELLKQNDGSYEINMSVKPDDAEVFGFSLGNSSGGSGISTSFKRVRANFDIATVFVANPICSKKGIEFVKYSKKNLSYLELSKTNFAAFSVKFAPSNSFGTIPVFPIVPAILI